MKTETEQFTQHESLSQEETLETVSLATFSKRRLLNSAKSLQYASFGRQPEGPFSEEIPARLEPKQRYGEEYSGKTSANDWRCPKESFYWNIVFAYSLIAYLWIIGFVFSAAFVNFNQAISALLLLPLGFAIHNMAQAAQLGRIHANGLRVSLSQFPEVYQIAETIAARMGIGKLPPIYLLPDATAGLGESAEYLKRVFIRRLLGQNIIVLPYGLLNLAEEIESPTAQVSARQDHLTRSLANSDVLRFILVRELARVRRRHLQGRWLLWPALFTPGLGAYYERACHSSCDRMAAFCEPMATVNGLKVLAFGKNLGGCLNLRAYVKDVKCQRSLWARLVEASSPAVPFNARIEQLLSLPFIAANV